MAALASGLGFFVPDIAVEELPAWDCLPYDRVSPHAGMVAQRMIALSRLARVKGQERPSILLTTVNAALQRVPPKDLLGQQSLSAAPGNLLDMEGVISWLELNGFIRASTVREPGDYAVRGGIVDLFAPGMDLPVRLDFFGDTLESIRGFDPETQRTERELRALDLVPVAEFQLTTETIRRFRLGYVAAFGAADPADLLYEAVSEGRRHPGMEHWLPLFHQRLDTLFDYTPGSPIVLEPLAEDAARERFTQITDYYDARQQAIGARDAGPPYHPLPPDKLYLAQTEWQKRLTASSLARLTPFSVPDGAAFDVGARQSRNFAAERAEPGGNVFDAVAAHI
ncbi:MAG: transcription-repair coupling factor, partial [Sphingomicrobium sp.]